MALFSRTKKEEVKTEATPVAAIAPMKGDYTHVLRNPRITEKASMAMGGSAYVFDVALDANKKQIMAAVHSVYKVKPRKVRVVNVKPKTVRNMRTGKRGMKGGFKKAYVYLNKGETISVT
ncbi:MAG TPA: 50S ribosomal protein L23 [Candidatus Paceibacterota bacterium]|nr:50S ribosomal protein L23 [Candidatus Paceibacterota bacterium]